MTSLMTRFCALFALAVTSCTQAKDTSGIIPKDNDDFGGKPVATAIVAGGCFWCTEEMFQQLPGVLQVVSGYTAGNEKDPTYKEVSMGKTSHTEAIKVTYDPAKLTYRQVIDHLWKIHDPTTLNRQGNDAGPQYRSGIYYATEKEHKIAETSKAAVASKFKKTIVTEIKQATTFYPAEAYHQNYYRKNPNDRYCNAVLVPKLKKLGMKTAQQLLADAQKEAPAE